MRSLVCAAALANFCYHAAWSVNYDQFTNWLGQQQWLRNHAFSYRIRVWHWYEDDRVEHDRARGNRDAVRRLIHVHQWYRLGRTILRPRLWLWL
jgi:hypothetical protein